MKTALILKKMAAIVAIVGAGLLAAPLEQAQAQVLSPSAINEVTLWVPDGKSAASGISAIILDIHVFDTSAILDPDLAYAVEVYWPVAGDRDLIRNFGDRAVRTEYSWYYFPALPAGNTYTVKFYMADDPDDCIKIVIEVSSDGDVSATEYDSDGNYRSVDVTIE